MINSRKIIYVELEEIYIADMLMRNGISDLVIRFPNNYSKHKEILALKGTPPNKQCYKQT